MKASAKSKMKQRIREAFVRKMSPDLQEAVKERYILACCDPKWRLAEISELHSWFNKVYGVPTKVLKEWSLSDKVQKEIRKNIRILFGGGERIKELYDILWTRAREGSVAAIKLAMEVTGEYTPRLNVREEKTVEDYLEDLEKEEGFKTQDANIRKELMEARERLLN